MHKTSLTVFLCSTYGDLSAERDGVLEAVRKLQLQHDSMEFFGARAAPPIETCLEEVRLSDVLVVIVGYKYGSLVPDKTISFTEAEYSEGYGLGKPCLVYLRDENAPILPAHIERDPQKLQSLERFKELLKARHTVATFKGAGDLAVSVAADLSRTVRAIEEVTRARDDNQRPPSQEPNAAEYAVFKWLERQHPNRVAYAGASMCFTYVVDHPDGTAMGVEVKCFRMLRGHVKRRLSETVHKLSRAIIEGGKYTRMSLVLVAAHTDMLARLNRYANELGAPNISFVLGLLNASGEFEAIWSTPFEP